jgi:hypothetical protein
MVKQMLWQESYCAALLELNHASLKSSIDTARAAIEQAMKEPNGDRRLEDKQAMMEALRTLQTLERLELQRSGPSDSPLVAWGGGM